jgi:hypothetical protein
VWLKDIARAPASGSGLAMTRTVGASFMRRPRHSRCGDLERLESWKSVRVAATAPMLVEKEKPVPRAELVQREAGVPFPQHRSSRGPRVREQDVLRCSESWLYSQF